MAKATKRQMIEREEDIQDALRLGKDFRAFGPELAKKHKCSKSSIQRQYLNLVSEMASKQKDSREELRVELMLKTQHLYDLALENGNIKNALDALNSQAKMGGLFQPEKAEKVEKIAPPSFHFVERDNSIPLAVVPKDDDDRDTGTN